MIRIKHTSQFTLKIAALVHTYVLQNFSYNTLLRGSLFPECCDVRRTVPAEYCSLKYSPHPPKEHSEFPNPGRPLDV